MTLNINILGGPGVGKSVLMCQLFVDLKRRGIHAEIVPEVAKELHYEGKLQTTTQNRILREQYRRQARVQGKAEVVITDGPLGLSLAYVAGPAARARTAKRLLKLTAGWDCLNVLVHRDLDAGYEREGRYQTKDQAKFFHEHHIVPLMRTFYGEALQELQVDEAPGVVLGQVLAQLRPAPITA